VKHSTDSTLVAQYVVRCTDLRCRPTTAINLSPPASSDQRPRPVHHDPACLQEPHQDQRAQELNVSMLTRRPRQAPYGCRGDPLLSPSDAALARGGLM